MATVVDQVSKVTLDYSSNQKLHYQYQTQIEAANSNSKDY
jgi:hypothetical protein